MVCHRCKMVVETELEKLDLHPVKVELGQALIEEKDLSKEQLTMISDVLERVGFELIDDKRTRIIEQIKNLVIDRIHHSNELPDKNYSDLLAQHLHHDYSFLSNLFSEMENTTIEKFIIGQKIEKVKELITYDELSLGDIAFRLGYSSAAHLSNQFKKVTGLTPGYFRQAGINKRKPIDKV